MHAAQTPDHPGPPQPEPLHGSAAPTNAARILSDEEVADMAAQAEAVDEEIDPELDADDPPAADSVRASGEAP